MEVVGANDTVGDVCKDNKNGCDETEMKKNEHTSTQRKIPTSSCEWAGLVISVSYGKVEFTTQMFDPALGIGKLLLEIFYFFMTPSLAFADMQNLVNALNR